MTEPLWTCLHCGQPAPCGCGSNPVVTGTGSGSAPSDLAAAVNPLVAELAALAAQLPPGLRSDWKYTNHYELQAPDHEDGYWWWMLSEVREDEETYRPDTVAGQRLGLLMDIAAKLREVYDANGGKL